VKPVPLNDQPWAAIFNIPSYTDLYHLPHLPLEYRLLDLSPVTSLAGGIS
jgi:hypothetical protein